MSVCFSISNSKDAPIQCAIPPDPIFDDPLAWRWVGGIQLYRRSAAVLSRIEAVSTGVLGRDAALSECWVGAELHNRHHRRRFIGDREFPRCRHREGLGAKSPSIIDFRINTARAVFSCSLGAADRSGQAYIVGPRLRRLLWPGGEG